MALSVNVFGFVSEDKRIMYESAFNAITQLELWNYMKNFKGESFMLSNDKEVNCIYSKIENLGYYEHSGASFGVTMRIMEYIAKNGLDKFQQEYTRIHSI